MTEVNNALAMCLGSALMAWFIMLMAANMARLVRYVASSEDE